MEQETDAQTGRFPACGHTALPDPQVETNLFLEPGYALGEQGESVLDLAPLHPLEQMKWVLSFFLIPLSL